MFDQNKFASILKEINETYNTMTDFGKSASFDRTYISKYINKKLSNPPTPKILEKIAKASNGVTTYSELMDICGYLDIPSRKTIKKQIYDSNKIEIINHNFSDDEIKIIEDYLLSDSSEPDNNQKFNRFEKLLYSLEEDKKNFLLEFCPKILLNVSSELIRFSDKVGAVFNKSQKISNELMTIDELGNPVVFIPILGTVKAEYNYLAEENWIGTVDVDKKLSESGELFALKVKGDSMSPTLMEDDIVIIKKQDDFENGDIVVAIINGEEATIKKGKKSEAGILLQPLNSNYEPLIFTYDEVKTIPVTIVGIVKQLKREF